VAGKQSVVVVRHGETEWSRANRHTGHSDIPLTEEGRAQALRLHSVLSAWTFAAVFTSPLSRAAETCALAGYGDVAVADPELMEWDYGEYEGKTLEEIRRTHPGWRLFRDGVVGGEALSAVAARADHVISRARAIDGDVLLFAHGHILRVVTAVWLELPVENGERFSLSAAGIGVLCYEHDWTSLRRWNIEAQ
jgi:broad specificity phosphatase PhoE